MICVPVWCVLEYWGWWGWWDWEVVGVGLETVGWDGGCQCGWVKVKVLEVVSGFKSFVEGDV